MGQLMQLLAAHYLILGVWHFADVVIAILILFRIQKWATFGIAVVAITTLGVMALVTHSIIVAHNSKTDITAVTGGLYITVIVLTTPIAVVELILSVFRVAVLSSIKAVWKVGGGGEEKKSATELLSSEGAATRLRSTSTSSLPPPHSTESMPPHSLN
eukprot:Selendium_serpulae@DN7560_c0_g1_i1.p1